MSNESINNEINVGALSEAINEKMDRNLVNADAIGQAILDKKVEVEALLEQNGYAKFTWKEDNKVANLIVQWGVISTSTSTEVNLPITYTSWYSILLGPINAKGAWTASTYENSSSIKTLSSFVLGGTGVNSTSGSSGAYWFTIGY